MCRVFAVCAHTVLLFIVVDSALFIILKLSEKYFSDNLSTIHAKFKVQQAVACIPTNRVRGYATHPTCGRRKP